MEITHGAGAQSPIFILFVEPQLLFFFILVDFYIAPLDWQLLFDC